jgi:hypothetical protein
MKDRYMRQWDWNREQDRDTLIRRKIVEGLPEAEAVALVRPCTRRIRAVCTRLYWGKRARQLSISYGVEGPDREINFWFFIPWLFGIAITLRCNQEWFDRKYPDLATGKKDRDYSLTVTGSHVALYWADSSNCYGGERSGFRWIGEWVDILRGQTTRVDWTKAELVAEKDINLRVVRKSTLHPNTPYWQRTRVQVFKKTGTWHFSRWFPKKYVRWEVQCDQVFLMSGKGDNGWDQEQWQWGGYNFDPELQQCNFGCSAKNAQDAIDQFVESFNRYQQPS